MHQITIRQAIAADTSRIVQIYVDSWNRGFGALMPSIALTADRVARWERALMAPVPQRWWVAEIGGAIVGFVGIGLSRDPLDSALGELDTIAVDPVWWRAGVGRALMDVALRGLAEQGWRAAILWTLADYEQGQRFYAARGWQLDGGMRDKGRQVRYRYRFAV